MECELHTLDLGILGAMIPPRLLGSERESVAFYHCRVAAEASAMQRAMVYPELVQPAPPTGG